MTARLPARCLGFLLACLLPWLAHAESPAAQAPAADTRPNFVFITTDDQSWAHTSRAGYPLVKTPNFDQLAQEGVYFSHAYVTAPSCTTSRGGMLSGQHAWMTRSAAILGGVWPADLVSYQDILAEHGYVTGYTGKGYGPGGLAAGRLGKDPAGKPYNSIFMNPRDDAWTVWDLNANLQQFLKEKPAGQPFSFWIGSFEPHRPYVKPDPSRFAGHDPATFLPGFLPDIPPIRENLSSYLIEIEKFDRDLGTILQTLRDAGQLDNTIVIVTSDNGMDLPRAKTQNYEYGVRVPFAVRWGKGITTPGRQVDDMVSLVDIAPTFLNAAGIPVPDTMVGKSLLPLLASGKGGQVDPKRTAVFSAYERHSAWRKDDQQTYPRRAIHTARYAYIRNYAPDRWPAGFPPVFAEATQEWLWDSQAGKHVEPYYSLATAKRPREELYDLQSDPFQLLNIADQPAMREIKRDLAAQLDRELVRTKDPVHATGNVDHFVQYITPDNKLPAEQMKKYQ